MKIGHMTLWIRWCFAFFREFYCRRLATDTPRVAYHAIGSGWMAWQIFFLLKKPLKTSNNWWKMDKKHYDLWKKACGNLCRGQKKEIWFPYESRYRTPEPQDASCRFSVHKNFFCGYYKSNNEKITCTPRLIIFVLTHILQHFFACSTANLQIKLKPYVNHFMMLFSAKF